MSFFNSKPRVKRFPLKKNKSISFISPSSEYGFGYKLGETLGQGRETLSSSKDHHEWQQQQQQ